MDLTDQILNQPGAPGELERLYRQDPGEFARRFPALFEQHSDSLLLQAWQARLTYIEAGAAPVEKPARKPFLFVLLLALVFGTLLSLPFLFSGSQVEEALIQNYFIRNGPMLVLLALCAYFVLRRYPGPRILTVLIVLAAGAAVYINLLPDIDRSDTVILSMLHLPFLIWSLLGLAFTGKQWRETGPRVRFIRYNGELFIYSVLFVLGSGVMFGLAVALFGLLSGSLLLHLEQFFMKHLFWYGLVGIPLLATFLIERLPEGKAPFAAVLARVFSPLFLILVIVYIVIMLANQRSPFQDREVLIVFNLLLAVVLGISVFSILERPDRPRGGYQDLINLALVGVTVILDAVALAAILFRLTSFGLTPNRLAVLGANLLFFIHLAGICYFYFRLLTGRGTAARLESWIVQYLPAYTAWVLVVIAAFPLIFQYR